MWMDHVLKVESNHSKSGQVTRVCRTAVRRWEWPDSWDTGRSWRYSSSVTGRTTESDFHLCTSQPTEMTSAPHHYCFTSNSSHQPRSHTLVSYDLSVFIANASYIFISISKDFALLPVCSKLLHKPIQWHMANLTLTSRKTLNHANANCLQEFVHKNVQNIHHFQGHMPEDAFFTGQLQCQ